MVLLSDSKPGTNYTPKGSLNQEEGIDLDETPGSQANHNSPSAFSCYLQRLVLNSTLTIPFFTETWKKRCTCFNLLDSLIQICLIMSADYEKLYMGSAPRAWFTKLISSLSFLSILIYIIMNKHLYCHHYWAPYYLPLLSGTKVSYVLSISTAGTEGHKQVFLLRMELANPGFFSLLQSSSSSRSGLGKLA